MIALLQRVTRADVQVASKAVGEIGRGLAVLVCAERGDTVRQADALLDKLVNFRVFGDDQGKMNRSLRDVAGGLLLIPQFTLAADTKSGTRPSFTPAAAPAEGRKLFEQFVAAARTRYACDLAHVATGEFGADMQVTLTNDGPVTFWLQVHPQSSTRSLQ